MAKRILIGLALLPLFSVVGLSTQPQDDENPVRALEKQIAGKENEPAENVFKNIKVLTGVPAIRLLRMMEHGFSPSLGVECTHCHVAGNWASDSLAAKDVARKMMHMVRTINDELKTIDEKAHVNCYTCHRGQPKPESERPR